MDLYNAIIDAIPAIDDLFTLRDMSECDWTKNMVVVSLKDSKLQVRLAFEFTFDEEVKESVILYASTIKGLLPEIDNAKYTEVTTKVYDDENCLVLWVYLEFNVAKS